MREEVANVVYPVFAYGIRLREQIVAGDALDLKQCQKELLARLNAANQVIRGGEFSSETRFGQSTMSRSADNVFLGIRYPLTCWIDEILTDSPWKEQWKDNILELTLYGSRERAWRFWEQAKKAVGQPNTDALEVFYLCAVLGFRGDNSLEEVKEWCRNTKAQIDQSNEQEWSGPVEGQPRTFVPPLHGVQKLQAMMKIAGLALLLMIPIVFFLIFRPR